MCHRTGILRKLVRTQQPYIFNALYSTGMGISSKLLIPKYRQSLFKAKLEPVPARHPVTCPVMEIFMANHRFNSDIIVIGSRFRAGKNQSGIKNIQPLVLHRPHIEIIYSNNHEQIKIVFEAKTLFIPGHGRLE